jgi:hypothetical protein
MGLARKVGGCPAPPCAKTYLQVCKASLVYIYKVCKVGNETKVNLKM